jgi:ribosomal protein L11 methyltransferase
VAPVAYVSLRFDTAAGSAEAWAEALLEAGALSVDLADPAAGTAAETPLYGEPGAPAPTSWPVSRLTALFGGDDDPASALAAAAAALGAPVPNYEVGTVPERDWVRATQDQFAPIQVAERLWIVPSWCEPVDPTAVNLALDPGLAFGTGSHPTTRLCLRWLTRELGPGEAVLDYGCGSGILAIAAKRLGAGLVVGTDVDPQAIVASKSNASANAVAVAFLLPDALAEVAPRTFDVVIANILANPLVLLAPALAARVRDGGRIVLSGILSPQAGEVIAAYAPWFNIHVWDEDDGWVALGGIRRSTSR